MIMDCCERRKIVGDCSNFRDLGGYVTADGKHRTVFNRLYRSDHLAKVRGAEEVDMLTKTLNVGYAIDFRGGEERRRDRYRFAGVEKIEIPIEPGDVLRSLFEHPELSTEAAEDGMCHLNEVLAGKYQAEYAQFMNHIVTKAPGDKAIVFHCTAGKDRTGFGAALILLTLGVPLETVMEDYLLTNVYFKPPAQHQILAKMPGKRVEEGALDALFFVKREYLDTALQLIHYRYGDVPQYVRNQLGVTEEQIKLMKAHYLVPNTQK